MKRFNLSEWAITHQALVLFTILLLAAAGAYSFFNLGRGEDPPFTIKEMVVSAPGRGPPRARCEPGHREDRDQAAGAALLRHRPELLPARRDRDRGAAERRHPSRQGPGPLVPGAQEGRRHRPRCRQASSARSSTTNTATPTACICSLPTGAGRAQGRKPSIRQRLLRVPDVTKADLIGVQDGEDLHRVQPHAARPAGRTGRPDPRHRRRQNARGDRDGRDHGRPRLGARRRRRSRAEQWPRCRSAPTASFSSRTSPRSSAATRTRRVLVRQGQAGDRTRRRHAARRQRADPRRDAGAGDERDQVELPVGINVHKVADQPEVVEESVSEFISPRRGAGHRAGREVHLARRGAPASSWRCRCRWCWRSSSSVMTLLGIDFQRISLGALIIALGLLVDDAIIAVEMMMVKLEQGASRIEAPPPSPTPRPRSRC